MQPTKGFRIVVRCLVGMLNIPGAYALITKEEIKQMTNEKSGAITIQASEADNAIAQPSEMFNLSLEHSMAATFNNGSRSCDSF